MAACAPPPKPQPDCAQGVTPAMIEQATKDIGKSETNKCVEWSGKARSATYDTTVFTRCVNQVIHTRTVTSGMRR
jgi:hypothetical protein